MQEKITLPEYKVPFYLRKYFQPKLDNCYICHLVGIFREIKRVLRKDGTVWLNMGDSYASGKGSCFNPGGGANSLEGHAKLKAHGAYKLNRPNISDLEAMGLKPKDLCMIPARLALALQAEGWWLRSAITWCKGSPMPESVKDRSTSATEMIFLLTKSMKYYYDSLAVSQPRAAGATDFTSFGRAALAPKFSATIHTEDISFNGGGFLDFGQSKISISNSMTTNTQRLQIVNMVGFNIRVEVSEGNFMMNMNSRDLLSLSADLAGKIISFQSNFSLGSPIRSLVLDLPASPSGAILTSHIDADPLPSTFLGAKISFMECAFIPEKFFAANITMNFNQFRATLFIWTSLPSSHSVVSFHPKNNKNIIESQGRNLWNWWLINPQPFPDAHFAVFPEKLVEPCIKAGTSEKGCCPECGAPWKRIVKKNRTFESGSGKSGNMPIGKRGSNLQGDGETLDIRRGVVVYTQTVGWKPGCNCKKDPVPCVVLDPFGGAGTVGVVAYKLNRDFLLIELSPEYCEMAKKRIGKTVKRFESGFGLMRPKPLKKKKPKKLGLLDK